jgi:hypothetical protein
MKGVVRGTCHERRHQRRQRVRPTCVFRFTEAAAVRKGEAAAAVRGPRHSLNRALVDGSGRRTFTFAGLARRKSRDRRRSCGAKRR